MDESNIIDLLDVEFREQMAKLKSPDTQEEEMVKILNRIETISKIRNERVKVDFEVIDFEEKRKEENRKNEQKTKDDKRNFWSTIGIAIFEVGVPILAYSIWAYKGFKFEENGTIRSQVSKNINGRMKATK